MVFPENAPGIAVQADAIYPGQVRPDAGKNLNQTVNGNDQSITITDEYPFLLFAVSGSKGDIIVDGFLVLDAETHTLKGPAESAFIV